MYLAGRGCPSILATLRTGWRSGQPCQVNDQRCRTRRTWVSPQTRTGRDALKAAKDRASFDPCHRRGISRTRSQRWPLMRKHPQPGILSACLKSSWLRVTRLSLQAEYLSGQPLLLRRQCRRARSAGVELLLEVQIRNRALEPSMLPPRPYRLVRDP